METMVPKWHFLGDPRRGEDRPRCSHCSAGRRTSDPRRTTNQGDCCGGATGGSGPIKQRCGRRPDSVVEWSFWMVPDRRGSSAKPSPEQRGSGTMAIARRCTDRSASWIQGISMNQHVMVAALFVAKGGCYFGLEGVDPWDETRDARLYPGPHPAPAVTHPPDRGGGSRGAPEGGENRRLPAPERPPARRHADPLPRFTPWDRKRGRRLMSDVG